MTRTRTLLFVFASLLSFNALAQKDTWIVDLNAGFDNQKYASKNSSDESVVTSSWTLHAHVGKQLSDHFVLGLLGGYGEQQELIRYYIYSGYDLNKYKTTLWQVGAYGRYTYSISKHIFVYSQFSVSKYGNDTKMISSTSSNYPGPVDNSIPEDGNGLLVNLYPAIGLNIINGFGVHMDVGGIYYSRFYTPYSDISRLHVNFGQQFSFGLHKIIGWKKHTAVASTNSGQ